MLTQNEMKVLELLERQRLVKLNEIRSNLSLEHDGVSSIIQRLIMLEMIKAVEPIGEKCFIITRRGSMELKGTKEKDTEPDKDPKGLYRRF